ncbi:MAG: hypothetical protein NTV37_03905 [Proteobacteria bacterium]|nr:hypothetical protein [Pseudomonadota bacterium]
MLGVMQLNNIGQKLAYATGSYVPFSDGRDVMGEWPQDIAVTQNFLGSAVLKLAERQLSKNSNAYSPPVTVIRARLQFECLICDVAK